MKLKKKNKLWKLNYSRGPQTNEPYKGGRGGGSCWKCLRTTDLQWSLPITYSVVKRAKHLVCLQPLTNCMLSPGDARHVVLMITVNNTPKQQIYYSNISYLIINYEAISRNNAVISHYCLHHVNIFMSSVCLIALSLDNDSSKWPVHLPVLWGGWYS